MDRPTCGKQADVLITNIGAGSKFCHGCAPPSFMPHHILTIDDVAF
jgi:ribosomal protein S27AE